MHFWNDHLFLLLLNKDCRIFKENIPSNNNQWTKSAKRKKKKDSANCMNAAKG